MSCVASAMLPQPPPGHVDMNDSNNNGIHGEHQAAEVKKTLKMVRRKKSSTGGADDAKSQEAGAPASLMCENWYA